jgi:hypothetical protein
MSYGHARNTGIPYIREYADAVAKFENTKPIKGTGANGGRIALGHRHRVAEFYMEKKHDGRVECICYRTPVVTYHPDGNIELNSGGWGSQTTAYFIEEVLPVSCRVKDSSLVIGIDGGEYKMSRGLMLKRIDGKLTPQNVEPDYVYRVKRKEATKARQRYAEFIKFFTGMTKLRGEDVITDEEFIRMFGADESRGGHTTKAQMPSDIALRNKEQVESMFAMMESDDHEMRYKACLLIIKQFGKRHYWQNMGYSITPESVRKALNDLIFARHKDEVFEVVEVPLGTIKKDSWSHLF